jgi:hypothetical protein
MQILDAQRMLHVLPFAAFALELAHVAAHVDGHSASVYLVSGLVVAC